jgi:hypothetical protein
MIGESTQYLPSHLPRSRADVETAQRPARSVPLVTLAARRDYRGGRLPTLSAV